MTEEKELDESIEIKSFKGFKCGNEQCEAIYEYEHDAKDCHPCIEVTAYICPKCDEVYEDEFDARECCEEE